jgi:hypothetical protein
LKRTMFLRKRNGEMRKHKTPLSMAIDSHLLLWYFYDSYFPTPYQCILIINLSTCALTKI